MVYYICSLHMNHGSESTNIFYVAVNLSNQVVILPTFYEYSAVVMSYCFCTWIAISDLYDFEM